MTSGDTRWELDEQATPAALWNPLCQVISSHASLVLRTTRQRGASTNLRSGHPAAAPSQQTTRLALEKFTDQTLLQLCLVTIYKQVIQEPQQCPW
jgi:hypothetical protein